MTRRGRRTKYTPEVVEALEHAIELGSSYKLACAYAGISFETFSVWRNTKPEFSDRIARAEGHGAVELLGKIEKAASDGDWRVAAWKLERRYPDDYGRQVHQLQGNEDVPIVFTLHLGDREMTDGADGE